MLPSIPPLHRIPLSTHLSLAALALLCVGYAGYSVNMKQTSGLKTAQLDLQSIQSQLNNSNAVGSKDTASKSFAESLPSTVKSDDVLRDMSRLAVMGDQDLLVIETPLPVRILTAGEALLAVGLFPV